MHGVLDTAQGARREGTRELYLSDSLAREQVRREAGAAVCRHRVAGERILAQDVVCVRGGHGLDCWDCSKEVVDLYRVHTDRVQLVVAALARTVRRGRVKVIARCGHARVEREDEARRARV